MSFSKWSPATAQVRDQSLVVYSINLANQYNSVGISVGVPDNAYSFSGSWHKLSKLILCAVMLRGRHRGLPIAIDRAVLLPDERQDLAEEEDAAIRMERAVSRHTVSGDVV
jgi:Trk-type K+ transport system membrane component